MTATHEQLYQAPPASRVAVQSASRLTSSAGSNHQTSHQGITSGCVDCHHFMGACLGAPETMQKNSAEKVQQQEWIMQLWLLSVRRI